MSNRFEPGYVLPKPQIPKLVGILNVVFGGLIVLFALGVIGVVFLSPAFTAAAQSSNANAQVAQEKSRRETIAELNAREAAATTEEEKSDARREREELESQPIPQQPPGMIRMNLGTRANRGAFATAFFWAEIILGLILNALMIVSGVGLLQLRRWARRLALWVFALKILRLVALCAVTVGVLLPGEARSTLDQAVAEGIREGRSEAEARRGATEIVQVVVVFGTINSVGTLALGVIYPAVAFALLSTRGAWAACQTGSTANGARSRTVPG